MVAGSITEEVALAVPAERMWKVAFADTKLALLPKACAGYVDAVEVDGEGGPGTVITLKLNPSMVYIKELQSRVVAFDAAARVVKTEVLQGGQVSAQLKTHVAEFKLEAGGGEGTSVFKVKVDYERLDGAALAPEDEAKLSHGHIRLIKMLEAYLLAHPDEVA